MIKFNVFKKSEKSEKSEVKLEISSESSYVIDIDEEAIIRDAKEKALVKQVVKSIEGLLGIDTSKVNIYGNCMADGFRHATILSIAKALTKQHLEDSPND